MIVHYDVEERPVTGPDRDAGPTAVVDADPAGAEARPVTNQLRSPWFMPSSLAEVMSEISETGIARLQNGA
ncbi:hypothetical protein [Micrococcus luteus]|uniref:hypothetical protein n=1 Tax=Micrococcus luteus TaxID=1270 RepID=UPI001F2D23BD|nr:hypothetical protein [Micrococcus luteus]